MNQLHLKIFLLVTLAIAIAVAAFYWNEARKEVVFLCGNFKQGDTEQLVRRQLNTGNLLHYRTERAPAGSRIIAASNYNLGMHRCIIEFDANGLVAESYVE